MYKKIKNKLIDFSFILPALAFYVFVVCIPFVRGIHISLTNWDGFSPTYKFIGLRNLWILLQDRDLLLPIKNTLLFTLLTLVFVNIFGLLIAIGLNAKIKGDKFLRTIIFMPIVTSLILSSFIWKYIYSDVFTNLLGVGSPLASTKWVMVGIAVICIWRDTGLAMVIYFAALKTIPKSLLEAATIDGANKFQKFRNITIPLITPAFTTCITFWLSWGLRVFAYPVAATGGGPGGASETLAMYVYNYTFPFQKAGYGQMAGIVLMAMVYILSTTVTRILRRREENIC